MIVNVKCVFFQLICVGMRQGRKVFCRYRSDPFTRCKCHILLCCCWLGTGRTSSLKKNCCSSYPLCRTRPNWSIPEKVFKTKSNVLSSIYVQVCRCCTDDAFQVFLCFRCWLQYRAKRNVAILLGYGRDRRQWCRVLTLTISSLLRTTELRPELAFAFQFRRICAARRATSQKY